MAGFLDKETRIVDMILTSEGRKLLANGELQFVYFALFDDEVDYDPYVSNSGSLTAEQLSGTVQDQLEASLVREASSGYRTGMNTSGSDFVNVHRPLFTMKQGSQVLPRLTASVGPTGSVKLEVKQVKHQEIYVKLDQNGNVTQQLGPVDRGYERYGSQDVPFDFQLWPPTVSPDILHQDGVLVRVFRTGSEGLVEVRERRDTNNDLTYNNDLTLRLGTKNGGG